MKIHQTDFSKGNVYRNILEVALPMSIAQLLNLLYNIVDRIYIGRIPEVGSVALGGVGICFPIVSLISAFTYLFGNGGSPLCSMELGRGNRDEAEKIMGNTFSMLVLCGILLTAISMLFYKPILYAFGASDITFPYARDYIQIYVVGTVAVMISIGMNPFINSQGFGNIGMLTVMIGAGINILLDPVFIFVLKMGVRGAAIATVISQTVSAVWVVYFLNGKKAVITLKKSAMHIQLKRIARISSLGISSFVMGFTNSLVQIVCNSTLQVYGGDVYVSVMTVLNSVREVFMMPALGVTNGASPVMSFNYGEKAYDRVKKAIKFITVFCIVFTTVAWLILTVFPEFFIKLFNDDANLLKSGVEAMHIYFFGFCFMAFQAAGQSVFVALGKAKYATFFSLFRKVIIVVPLTVILPMIGNLGVRGVFLAEPISNLIGGIACFVTMIITVLPEINEKKINIK